MKIKTLVCLLVASVTIQVTSSAESLVNGGFEDSNPLNGWSAWIAEGSITAVSGAEVSPFGSPAGTSTTAVRLIDGAGRYDSPALYQRFSLQGPVRFSFDFKLSEFSSDYWLVATTYHRVQPQADIFPFNIRIGSKDGFMVLSSGRSLFRPIDLGEWYRVVVDLDFATQRHSGSLTKFGGGRATWTDFRFAQTVPTVTDLRFYDYVAETAKNGDLYLDNVSVTNSPAVPEPSTYGAVAMGVLVVLIVRRRFGRKQS